MEHKNVWEKYDKNDLEAVNALSDAYRAFLDNGKTERECIDQIVNRIEEEGYVELDSLIKEGKTLKANNATKKLESITAADAGVEVATV